MFDQYVRFVPNNMQQPQQNVQGQQRGILPDGPPDPGRAQAGGQQTGMQISAQQQHPQFSQMGQLQQASYGPPSMQAQKSANMSMQPTGAQFSMSPMAAAANALRQGQPQGQFQRDQQQQNQQLGAPQTMIGRGQYNGPQQGYGYGMPQYQMPQQNVLQSVNSGDPQSVQNLMTALKNVGAGSNNTFMNAPGTQGQQAQGGFQGFGFQGYQGIGPQAQMYGGPMQSQLGYQGNMAGQGAGTWGQNYASQGGNYYGAGPQAYGGGVQGGGTGGVQGQPGWNTPAPWTPTYSAPYSEKGREAYAEQTLNPLFQSEGPGQQGAFYSGLGPEGYRGSAYDNKVDGTAVSDQTAKTQIRSGEDELKEFLDGLGAYSYEYIDPKYGEGRRISPMAQEIEKTQLGKAAISTNNEGYKMVDYGKLAGTQLAALALLNQKYNELSERVGASVKQKYSKGK